jgi:hypothetical protein
MIAESEYRELVLGILPGNDSLPYFTYANACRHDKLDFKSFKQGSAASIDMI